MLYESFTTTSRSLCQHAESDEQVEEQNKILHRFNKESIEEMQYTLNQMYEDLQTLKKDNGLDDLLSETERKKING